jgi:hypothetical protein
VKAIKAKVAAGKDIRRIARAHSAPEAVAVSGPSNSGEAASGEHCELDG